MVKRVLMIAYHYPPLRGRSGIQNAQIPNVDPARLYSRRSRIGELAALLDEVMSKKNLSKLETATNRSQDKA